MLHPRVNINSWAFGMLWSVTYTHRNTVMSSLGSLIAMTCSKFQTAITGIAEEDVMVPVLMISFQFEATVVLEIFILLSQPEVFVLI